MYHVQPEVHILIHPKEIINEEHKDLCQRIFIAS